MSIFKLGNSFRLIKLSLCLKKTHQLWNGIAQNYNNRFWWNLAKTFKILQNRVCMFRFLCRCAFLSTCCLSNWTPKITWILTLYQANEPTLTSAIFLKIKHIPKLIIFGTYNLQTFKHNTLTNKILLLQFYLFNIRPNLHHWQLRKLCITLFRTFSTSPASCWCCCSSNLCLETLL